NPTHDRPGTQRPPLDVRAHLCRFQANVAKIRGRREPGGHLAEFSTGGRCRPPAAGRITWGVIAPQARKTRISLAAEGFRAIDDARRDEDHQLAPRVARPATLKQETQERNVSEERYL